MAEEQAEIEEKGKSSVVKIVMIVLGILLLIVLSVVGTLFATGFFDKTEKESVEEQIAELEAEAEAEAEGLEGEAGGEPVPVPLETPELQKFKKSYKEIKKSFVSNIKNSRKVMQVQVGIMTHYDEKVITNVETHEMAHILEGPADYKASALPKNSPSPGHLWLSCVFEDLTLRGHQ